MTPSRFLLAEFKRARQAIVLSEEARDVLGQLMDPLVVVSFVGYDKAVQASLWSSLSQKYPQDKDSHPLASATATSGIWAWLSDPASEIEGHPHVRTLYLLSFSPEEEHPRHQEDDRSTKDLPSQEQRAFILLFLCSDQLTVVSADTLDIQKDLKHLHTLDLIQPDSDSLGSRTRKTLHWRWQEDSRSTLLPVSAHMNSTNTHCAHLKDIIDSVRSTRTDDTNHDQSILDTVRSSFQTIECHLPPSRTITRVHSSSRASANVDMEELFVGELRDLTLNDKYPDTMEWHPESTHEDDPSSNWRWLESFLDRNVEVETIHRLFDSSKTINGPVLTEALQASLLQINSPSFTFSKHHMRLGIRSKIQEEALRVGTQTYHRVMNEHLDRHPIPLPWHSLALAHQDALGKGMEEIERRFYGIYCQLPQALKAFRWSCQSLSDTSLDVTSRGLYLEYYTANASALQTHHLSTLDENWQQFVKDRLPGSTTTATTGSIIKDYPEFLMAIDQVRKNYLETCIPSPEAISVLESLDEMQQAQSVLFLQSIPAAASSAPTANGSSSTALASKRFSLTSATGIIPAGDPIVTNGLHGNATLPSGHAKDVQQHNHTQQMEQAPTELEQQIAQILQAKRTIEERTGSLPTEVGSANGQSSRPISYIRPRPNKEQRHQGSASFSTQKTETPSSLKESDSKMVVQFGWTLHMLHANTLQYAWIWTWLYNHEGSSRQNVVACDSKMYTASKWIILPSKDLIRTRKEWKVSYGDRVWLVSYWFSTRNAKMDLPEYLPCARGAPCRHIIPYGETYVICKTCPADILCMRCFRASDHTDHTMYLQCSWGTSVCVCGDPLRLKSSHSLHCSLHCAESERSYSKLAKGKPCQVKISPGEKVYRCKTCLLDSENEQSVLCARCFRSHNHFGHEYISQSADENTICSCMDNQSWVGNLKCAYHSAGALEDEYLPLKRGSRCGHVFQPGEDIYHCRDCSFNEFVVLCSRCFHGSGCVNHRWRMGEFKSPGIHESVSLTQAAQALEGDARSVKNLNEPPSPKDKHKAEEVDVRISCDCGDPEMFKTAFDCNYHLPAEFRPVPNLLHCNYLFKKLDPMYRCRTCHNVDDIGREPCKEDSSRKGIHDHGASDTWICVRCFDSDRHKDHVVELSINLLNEGLYCHCGDPAAWRHPPEQTTLSSSTPLLNTECQDDHNRQNVLCTVDIKEGMFYYRCRSCQTDANRIFCEGCFIRDAHEEHDYQRVCAPVGMETVRCGCGENSAFRFATHCQQHERAGGTNIVHRCHYKAKAGEWIAICSTCYPLKTASSTTSKAARSGSISAAGPMPSSFSSSSNSTSSGLATTMLNYSTISGPYLCLRCRQTSGHADHEIEWIKIEKDMSYPCACGSFRGESPRLAPSLCQYHTMIYKTTPSTTLYLHSHQHRSINHADHNEVTGYRYHDSDNDWIVTRPEGQVQVSEDGHADDVGTGGVNTRAGTSNTNTGLSPYLQWKDAFWLQHKNTGKYFNSMASLKISQGFQEVSALGGPHSNNDWIIEETTWLRQQILSDE